MNRSKHFLPLLLFLLAGLLCACAPTKDADESAATTLTLRAAEHPELELEQHQPQDFALGTDGLVYLLGEDGRVLAYHADGSLAAEYTLNLSEQGLTAYRLAAGDGVLYLLDGHNNAILTVAQGEVKTVSTLGFSDVGLVQSLFVDRDGTLYLSFADVEKDAYTAAVDPSEKEVRLIRETQPGYLLSPDRTYLPKILQAEDGTNQVSVTFYQDGRTMDTVLLCTAEPQRSLVGLRLYGLSDGSGAPAKYPGLLFEFINETEDPAQEKLLQTPVVLDLEDKTVQTASSSLTEDTVVEPSAAGCYAMVCSGDTLTIQGVSKCFSGGGSNAARWVVTVG